MLHKLVLDLMQAGQDAMTKILNKKNLLKVNLLFWSKQRAGKGEKKLKQKRLRKKENSLLRSRNVKWCAESSQMSKTERNCQRIAMMDAVQLLNVLQKHQKNIDEKVKETDSSIRKHAKLIINCFQERFHQCWEVCMQGQTRKVQQENSKTKGEGPHSLLVGM